MTPEIVQMSCLQAILEDWLAPLVKDSASPVFDAVDLSQMVIAGHSRGGKLATLLFAGQPSHSYPHQIPFAGKSHV